MTRTKSIPGLRDTCTVCDVDDRATGLEAARLLGFELLDGDRDPADPGEDALVPDPCLWRIAAVCHEQGGDAEGDDAGRGGEWLGGPR